MHCDMLKIQDGGAIVEKLNYQGLRWRYLPQPAVSADNANLLP